MRSLLTFHVSLSLNVAEHGHGMYVLLVAATRKLGVLMSSSATPITEKPRVSTPFRACIIAEEAT